jgi:hypothetical protein
VSESCPALRKPKEQEFFASFLQRRGIFFSEEKKQKTFMSCAVRQIS